MTPVDQTLFGDGGNCPINEQTADGTPCGRCCYHLPDGKTCPRHGDVEQEVAYFALTQHTTPENVMRKRKGLPLLPKAGEAKHE